jgi:hypothetical protein
MIFDVKIVESLRRKDESVANWHKTSVRIVSMITKLKNDSNVLVCAM